jgi:glutathionyl-hydroquinone reductase
MQSADPEPQIIRMFYTAFDHLLPSEYANVNLYPEQHRKEIDAQNEWVYDTVNSEPFSRHS